MELSTRDERLLRRAIEVSSRAAANGNMPYGAVLADADGNILLEAENTTITGKNPLKHAETNLVNLAVTTLTPEQISGATLYASCEPCAMCSGAILSGGLNRVVYGMSALDHLDIPGFDRRKATMGGVSSRSILTSGQRHIEVSGPHLVEEASTVHRDSLACQPSPADRTRAANDLKRNGNA